MIQKLKNQDPYVRPNQNWIVQKEFVGDEVIEIRKLSMRGKRRVVTLAITAFTVGSLLILLNSPLKNSILVPGQLSSTHAQIIAGQGADRCSACHPGGNQSLATMMLGSLSSTANSKCQSDLCMKCHKNSITPEFALNPHNIDPRELITEDSRFKQVSIAKLVGASPPVNNDDELACNTCHREHHGAEDLKHLTDRQCQTCHTNVYHSFESDHPEFTNWPVNRRSRIAFDHVTHGTKHFPDKSAEFDCRQCHIDDSFANVQELAPFAVSCAGCHEQQIVDSSQQGLTLFSLPMLDVEAIRSADADVGGWPDASTGDFDGQIPPMMRLLLASDSRTANVLVQLGDGFEFSDVDSADQRQVKLASQLAWSIKYLLFDLSLKGEIAVRERLSKILQRPVSDSEANQLINGISEATFQQASAKWFPNLSREVATHRYVKPVGKLSWLPTGAPLMKFKTQDASEELAPNPLKSLVKPDLTPLHNRNPESKPSASPSKVAWPPGNGAEDDSNSGAIISNSNSSHSDQKLNPRTAPSIDQWLADNPLAKQDNGLAITGSQDRYGKTQLPESPDLYGITPQTIVNSANFDRANKEEPHLAKQQVVRSSSIWQRDDLTFSISYRPKGHADPVAKAWSDLAGRVAFADVDLHAKPLFQAMTSLTGTGLCRTCHTVDRMTDETFSFNWSPEYRDPTIRSFTKFSHGPHLVLPTLRDCRQCHQLNDRLSNHEEFLNFDASQASSNFNPIIKSNCSSCHSEGRTENSCTQCHNYHIGSRIMGSGN